MKSNFIFSATAREQKGYSKPRSEVTWDGTSCLEKTCAMKSLASPGASIV